MNRIATGEKKRLRFKHDEFTVEGLITGIEIDMFGNYNITLTVIKPKKLHLTEITKRYLALAPVVIIE